VLFDSAVDSAGADLGRVFSLRSGDPKPRRESEIVRETLPL
jgi:hypothetical protein